MPRLAANLGMLFPEVGLLDRIERAAAVGFRGVEIPSPYGETMRDLSERLRHHDLLLALINVSPGVAAIPGREAGFREGLSRALEYAEALGCPQVHCVAGPTDDPGAEATFVANLRWASERARPAGLRLLVEPLNTRDNPGYFLTGTLQARRIIDQVEDDNVFLQFDFYHMQIMEGSLAETVEANLDIIRHFQAGGVPGRHEPDERQEINYPYLFDLIDRLGFDGWVGCEYRPRAGTVEGLTWARPYGVRGPATPIGEP